MKLTSLLMLTLWATGVAACTNRSEAPNPTASSASPASSSSSAKAAGSAEHDEENCGLHSTPRKRPPPPPEVVPLSEATLAKVSTLRISSRVGGVSLTRSGETWKVTGRNGCRPDQKRVADLFENLAALEASPVTGKATIKTFELQIQAQDEGRVVYELGIGQRTPEGDLTQLPQGSRRWMRGFDRELASPRLSDWCETVN